MEMNRSTLKHTTSFYADRQESNLYIHKLKADKTAICNFRGTFLFLLSVFIIFSFNVFSQANLNNIEVWEGWKIGNVIKVSGIIKYGNPLMKSDGEERYLIVQKIDEQPIDSSRTIKISCNPESLLKMNNCDTVTLLGYVSGGYFGIPNSNDYDIEYWQDKPFHFDLFFVVLKNDDEIRKEKR
jgi:hypothetical protein